MKRYHNAIVDARISIFINGSHVKVRVVQFVVVMMVIYKACYISDYDHSLLTEYTHKLIVIDEVQLYVVYLQAHYVLAKAFFCLNRISDASKICEYVLTSIDPSDKVNYPCDANGDVSDVHRCDDDHNDDNNIYIDVMN